MTFSELKLLLEEIDIKTDHVILGGKNKNRLSVSCPYAPWFHSTGDDRRPSMSIWLEQESFSRYKCYSCHETGSVWEIFRDLGVLEKNTELQALALKVQKMDKPSLARTFERKLEHIEEWGEPEQAAEREQLVLSPAILNNFEGAWGHPRSREYLESGRRRADASVVSFDAETCYRFDLRYDAGNNRIVFPVRSRDGDLVGAVGRDITGIAKSRYYNYFGFETGQAFAGLQFFGSDYKKVIVVEGFFDLLNIWKWAKEENRLVVASLKAELSELQLMLLGSLDIPVEIWYDSDEAGERGRSKSVEGGQKYGLLMKYARLPKDVDCGDLKESQFSNIIQNLKRRTFENVRNHYS
jgi:DNA primase